MILGEAVVYIKANMAHLTTGLSKAQTATKLAMGKMTSNVKKYEKQIKSAGKMMGIAGALITGAFALMVKSAISFEEQMAQVSTMLDKSAMHIMPEYKDALQAMSVEFGEATSTLSKGLYDILSASIPPAEALEVLAVSAQAAVAGITDTGTAADAITTVLNSYGFEASEAGRVSDQLFAIVKGGKITFDELAPSIGRAAATSNMAGFSFEDLGASISTITRAGISSNQAMTAVVGILKTFLKPMDDAIDVAEGFGLVLNTTTLKTIGLTGVMEKLKNASAEQLSAIFGNIRGLKGIAAALGDTEGYARDLDRMYNSLGLTQAAFDKQSEALGFQLKRLKQSFNVIAVTIGDILIPTMKKVVAWGLKVTSNFKQWAEKNKPLVETLTKLGAGLGIMLLALAPIALILPGIVASLGILKIAFLPFLVGGLIVAGLLKINSLLDEMNKIAYKAQISLNDLSVAQIDVEIESLAQEIKKLGEQIEYTSELPLSTSAQHGSIIDMKNSIMNLEMKMGLLIERRHELTKAQEEGIDTEEELAELDKEALKLKEEIAKAMEDERLAIEAEGRAQELANIQSEIELRLYELTHTEREIAVKDLDNLKEKYTEAGIAIKDINKWYALEIENLKEVKEERKEELTALQKIAEELQILGLHYEHQIHGMEYYKETLRTLIKQQELLEESLRKAGEEFGKESKEVYEATKALLRNKNAVVSLKKEMLSGIKIVAEVGVGIKAVGKITAEIIPEAKSMWEEMFTSIAENAGTTFSVIQDALSGFVNSISSAVSSAITSLVYMKQTNDKIKDEILQAEEEHKTELEKLQDDYNAAVAAGDNELAEGILANIERIKEEHSTMIGDMEGDMTTIGGVAKTFWEALKEAAIKALIEIIAKLIIIKGLMLIFSAFGWVLPFAGGGGVGFAKGGKVKGFAEGGGTDTVPAMLTPGEYVISKGMVDYIKRTGAITSDLIGAIQSGRETPKGYSGGGAVDGGSSITIGAGAIVINTPRFSDDDASEIFDTIEREARNRGLKFAIN